MKLNLRSLTLVLAIGVLFTSFAEAQFPTNVGAGQVNRQGRVRKNHVRNGAKENKAMTQAMKQCREAHKALEHALPIYQGKRANAIRQTRIAIDEIQIGVISSRGGNPNNPQTNQTQQAPLDTQSKRNYSLKQIQASQQRMAMGLDHLQKALAFLNEPQPDYSGHRANAIVAVQNAIQLVQQGITLINSN